MGRSGCEELKREKYREREREAKDRKRVKEREGSTYFSPGISMGSTSNNNYNDDDGSSSRLPLL